MKITVADSAGFCFGVAEAVQKAHALLDEGETFIMLGEIVHNQSVVDELIDGGAKLIDEAKEVPRNSRVLIRAHGIPPEVYDILTEKSCEIIDCTCPFVGKIHRLVSDARERGSTVIIAGDPNHAEVIGIKGHAGPGTIVFDDASQIDNVSFTDDSYVLVAQTTFSVKEFENIKKKLQNKIANLIIFDTICFTTASRQEEAADLARNSDIVLVLGSAGSSNTKKLVSVCQRYCRETFLLQRPEHVSEILKHRKLHNLQIGITAGASTPERMIREVIQVMTEQEVLNNQQEEKEEITEAEVETKVEAGVEEVAAEQEEKAAEANVAEDTEVDTAVADPVEDSAEAETKEEKPEEKEEKKDAESNGDIDFSEFIDSIPELKRGTIVKGTVVSYDDDFVYVDVKDKTDGKIPMHEFDNIPEFDVEKAAEDHQEMDVFVRNIRNTDMGKEILLSKARVDFAKHKEAIEKAYEEKTPVTVKVTNVVRDGVIASYGSVDLYVHRTQLELQMVEDLEPYRGKTFDVIITQFDPSRNRLRVSGSRRTLLQRERREKAKKLWEEIQVGDEYEGVVRNLTDFGAFVDIGGVDGLVHISELSWERIKHPSEVVSVGDHIKVFVKDFNKERRRVSLGFKRPENDPYYNIEERFPVGSIVRGVVVRMFPFGAFVEIAPGVDALCHISQISDYRLNRPDDVLQEGMEIDARVLEVSNEERKISISIKEVEPINPENPEEHMQKQPERKRRPRRNREDNRQKGDDLPTAYTDSGSGGSSMSSVANITITSEESAEALGLGKKEEAEEEPKAEEPKEEVEAEEEPKAEEPKEEAEAEEPKEEADMKDEAKEAEVKKDEEQIDGVDSPLKDEVEAEDVVDEDEAAEEAPVTGEDGDTTVSEGHSL